MILKSISSHLFSTIYFQWANSLNHNVSINVWSNLRLMLHGSNAPWRWNDCRLQILYVGLTIISFILIFMKLARIQVLLFELQNFAFLLIIVFTLLYSVLFNKWNINKYAWTKSITKKHLLYLNIGYCLFYNAN